MEDIRNNDKVKKNIDIHKITEKYLNRYSNGIMLFIFLILPFIGFFVGVKYGVLLTSSSLMTYSETSTELTSTTSDQRSPVTSTSTVASTTNLTLLDHGLILNDNYKTAAFSYPYPIAWEQKAKTIPSEITPIANMSIVAASYGDTVEEDVAKIILHLKILNNYNVPGCFEINMRHTPTELGEQTPPETKDFSFKKGGCMMDGKTTEYQDISFVVEPNVTNYVFYTGGLKNEIFIVKIIDSGLKIETTIREG